MDARRTILQDKILRDIDVIVIDRVMCHVSVKQTTSGFNSKMQRCISSILGARDIVLERSNFRIASV